VVWRNVFLSIIDLTKFIIMYELIIVGLGFDVKTDPWVQHSQDFTDVLKQLNEIKGSDTDSQDQNNKSEKHELETKSKASKSRIQ